MAKKFKADKFVHIILNSLLILLGIVFICSLYIGIQTTLLGKQYADFFGYSIFEVQSNSMEDEFSKGDLIIVNITKEVEVGDIISFEQDGAIITHRVVEAYNGTYITKGDANNTKDKSPVDSEQIIGKTTSVLPGFGILRSTIFNPFVLITLTLTLFIANFQLDKKNNKNKEGKSKMKILNYIKEKFLGKNNSQVEDKTTVNIFNDDEYNKISPVQQENNNQTIKSYSYQETKQVEPIVYNQEEKEINPSRKEPIFQNVESRNEEYKKESFQEERVIEPLVYGYKKEETISTLIENEAPQEVAPVVNTETKTIDNYSYNSSSAKEEDLSKTSIFRMVSVDVSDLDEEKDELEEIKEETEKEEIKEQERIKEQRRLEEEIVEEPEETLTHIEIDLLEKTTKKSKNIVEKLMLLKKSELEELISLILDEEDFTSSEKAIINKFTKVYLKARYYDTYEHAKNESFEKKIYNKIDKVVKDYALDLMDEYHGNDDKHNDMIIKYGNVLMVIFKLESNIGDSEVKREYYNKQLSKYIKERSLSETNAKKLISSVIQVQKKYTRTIKYLYEKIETNMFELVISKVSSKHHLLGTKLTHNLTFNKLYSGYIVDKTYSEGIIAEDKMEIHLTLLLNQISLDMLSSNFSKKYLVSFPSTIFSKEKKFEKMLKLFNDEYVKENIIILLKMSDLFKSKVMIKKLVKAGYHFALTIDKAVKTTEKDKTYFYIMDYIFASKKNPESSKVIANLPKDITRDIIYEEVESKTNEVGSE